MPVKYEKLFALLDNQGKSATYWLRQNGIHPAVVNKLRKNQRVNTDTIADICRLLDCQPGDIMEYVPDGDGPAPASTQEEGETVG